MWDPDATPRRSWPAEWHVEVVAETGSTNDDLLAAAARGAPDRSVLAALHQTAGRGRLDRRWDAPPGANLLVSLLVRDVPEHLHELTQRVALAAREAAVHVASVTPELKWPNDLLLSGRKLAGVLAQAGSAGGGIGPDHVVIGIGLNVRWAPEGAARLGEAVDPFDVLAELLLAYDRLPADIWPAYRAALATLGSIVRVERPGGVIQGRAVDVGRDGRLVVIDECAMSHHIDTGDVIHLRPAGPA
jgi:BirA family biotin operon repressor/biotin-[acetyl-CoA-carboxylase] ligase